MAPFKFDVKKDDMRYNQLRYEALGEVISEYIYRLLQSETNLLKAYVSLEFGLLKDVHYLGQFAVKGHFIRISNICMSCHLDMAGPPKRHLVKKT